MMKMAKEIDEERINFENNYWGTTTTSEIDDAIQDTEDDLTFDVNGFIDYTPYSTSASTTAPISTPSNLTKAVSGSDVVLTWDAVSVSDLAGYKIYTKSGDTYTLLQDITDESLTTYTVSGGSFLHHMLLLLMMIMLMEQMISQRDMRVGTHSISLL